MGGSPGIFATYQTPEDTEKKLFLNYRHNQKPIMKKQVITFGLLLFCLTAFTQTTDRKLQAKLGEAVKGFNGGLGVYIKNIRTGKIVAIDADSVFPTASIVKVPISIGIMEKIRNGELQYEQELIYKDSLLYAGEDILGSFKHGEKILLNKVMMLMLAMSDNTASLWLQSLAGGGARINAIMDSLELINTRVNSRTEGRRKNWENYGWGQTSPREMGTIMQMIYDNTLFPDSISDRLKRNLSNNFWDQNGALSQVPPHIQVFSKGGAVDGSRNEAMIVNSLKNPYIFCVFTKNIQDTSWKRSNEAWALVRKLSAIVWKHYNPGDKWIAPYQ